MSELKLIVGNKNYSSWSMRGWVLLKQAGIPFEEVVVRRVVAARRVLARRVGWRLPALRWVLGEVVFAAIGRCASCGLWASKGNKLTSKLPGI